MLFFAFACFFFIVQSTKFADFDPNSYPLFGLQRTFICLTRSYFFCVSLYKYYQEPKLYTRVLDGFNIGFTAVFLLECILKLIAFKPKVRQTYYVVCSPHKNSLASVMH